MQFKNIWELTGHVNKSLGSEFCNEFQYKRKELTSSGRTAGNNQLFGNTKETAANAGWSINKGGGVEVQYHLAFDGDENVLRYGLGFNTQYVPFATNTVAPEVLMKPYMSAFLYLSKEIEVILPEYKFIYGNEDQLINPKFDQYNLFGKEISLKVVDEQFFIDEQDYNNMLSDLKRQFPVYVKIFENRNRTVKMEKIISPIIQLLEYKKQIILQGPPGTGKTKLAKEIAEQLIQQNEATSFTLDEEVEGISAEYIKNHLSTGEKIKKKRVYFEIIGFNANTLTIKSEKSKEYYPSYNKIILSFTGKRWEQKGQYRGLRSYEDAIARHLYEAASEEVKAVDPIEIQSNESEYIKIVQFHPSFTYEDFVRGIVVSSVNNGQSLKYEAENKIIGDLCREALIDKDNNYVLIIDEINRANLSSVLGELIYALEYRGEAVDSIYKVGGSNKLIIPPNLYIIGTMNTADRSVGHIDYAIRRRFAFVDVLPKPLENTPELEFDSVLFEAVSKLFVKDINGLEPSVHLSSEFRPEDVWLGHSYFIKQKGTEIVPQVSMQIRLQYEVVPILKEYVRDGVLKSSALKIIDGLTTTL